MVGNNRFHKHAFDVQNHYNEMYILCKELNKHILMLSWSVWICRI